MPEPPHVDHVRPLQHRGTDDAGNLALTCDRCNAHKGTNLSAYDPQSDLTAPLFDPRRMEWHEHFEASGGEVRGLTPTGRATAGLLRMNEIKRRMLRLKLAEAGEWP